MIFSLPLIIILVERMMFKQILHQYPIILPPYKVIFFGKKNEGKKTIHINIIPKKKKNLKRMLLIIKIKVKQYYLTFLFLKLFLQKFYLSKFQQALFLDYNLNLKPYHMHLHHKL